MKNNNLNLSGFRWGLEIEAMFEKVGPVGGDKGSPFDDGVSNDVMKVTVAADEFSITYIEILYAKEKEGRYETIKHGTKRGEIKEVKINKNTREFC